MSANETLSAGSLNEPASLRIRSLIADKEMATAQANHDLARFGQWRCDYAAWHNQADAEILKLIGQANTEYPSQTKP